MATPLETAQYYASRQWLVFPLGPRSKKPLFPSAHEIGNPCKGECGQLGHGLHDAVTNAEIINDWWTRTPNAGVGIATGPRSGFFVLDVDTDRGGEASYQALVDKYGPLPETVVQITGTGGRHYLFQYPPVHIKNSNDKLGVGLDTRGEGGYIAAAPTIHPNGNQYRWLSAPSKTPIAPAPDWLLHLLMSDKPSESKARETQPSDGVFPTGSRNATLTALAGSMRRKNMGHEAILSALMAENKAKCDPPLSDGEVQTIAASVMRYEASAAPQMQDRDRHRAEWSFCVLIFEYPEELLYCEDITPAMFQDAKLGHFLERMQAGDSPVQAAVATDCLSEIESYQGWTFKANEYANVIRSFAHLDQITNLATRLQKAAANGDLEKLETLVMDINRTIEPKNDVRGVDVGAVDVRSEVEARAADPRDVWGIPYAWPKISYYTGGKHKGELILQAGEPGIGKSWWAIQDASHSACNGTPTWIWSGEMSEKQLKRRIYQLFGVSGRNMSTGRMTEQDWDLMNDADKMLAQIPLKIDDAPLHVSQFRGIMRRGVERYGIEYFVADYSFLIDAPGKDEVEKSAFVSREMKKVCNDKKYPLAGLLLSSVVKSGMDGGGETAGKANVRGSGQQIHDADVIYFLTKFHAPDNDMTALKYPPAKHENIITLHIKKGRELPPEVKNGVLHYSRFGTAVMTEESQEQKARLP